MTSNVIGLAGQVPSAAAQPRPEVIARLEDLLERARSGEIQHLAAVWIDAQGAPGDTSAPAGMALMSEIVMLVGALELCKATILSDLVGEGFDADH